MRRRLLLAIFGLTLTVQGCEQKRSDGGGETIDAKPLGLTEAPGAKAASPSLAGAVLDADARREMPRAQLELAESSRLPILVPRRWAGKGRLLVEANWYDFAFQDRDPATQMGVHIKGVGVVHDDVPFPKANETIAGRDVFINRSELIATASFRDHGVSYIVTLECGGRVCDDSGELRAIVSDLALVSAGSEGGAR